MVYLHHLVCQNGFSVMCLTNEKSLYRALSLSCGKLCDFDTKVNHENINSDVTFVPVLSFISDLHW